VSGRARIARALAAGLLAAAPSRAAELDADQWHSRIAEALRVGSTMSARAHMKVERPGDRDWDFDLEMMRRPEREGRRTVFEMREAGDPESIVSELVIAPGEPIVNWFWDVQKRRWLAVKGIQATDRWAETLFRHEDLWLADPSARRSGSVRSVEDGGSRWIELESAPYHYYLRVVTRVDPATALPRSVRFIDNTGVPIREQSFESVEMVDGRPFPKLVRIHDLVTGERSTLTFEQVRFDQEIPISFVDLSVIGDRITRGADPVPLESLRERRDPAGI
jgi:hypothetical protein